MILHPFGHPGVRAALSPVPGAEGTVDLDALLDLDGTLYLVAPASDQELFPGVADPHCRTAAQTPERVTQARTGWRYTSVLRKRRIDMGVSSNDRLRTRRNIGWHCGSLRVLRPW